MKLFVGWFAAIGFAWTAVTVLSASPDDVAGQPLPTSAGTTAEAPKSPPASIAELADSEGDFASQIAPLLKMHCLECHGPDKAQNGLRLNSFESLMKGGDSGKIVEPSNSATSRIIHVVDGTDEDGIVMPPKPKKRLTDREVSLLRKWIDRGAKWPAGVVLTRNPIAGDSINQQEHWAFLPVRRPKTPQLKNSERIRTPIDNFIQAELEANGLQLGPDADRATLIRRVSFDVTGLPPTLSELQEFVADRRPDAYEHMVERYLASPQYGERWGKYWLDAAGYADSNGYRHVDSERRFAWRYRDYVIQSFNNDKPYDLFVREQLAGDEMAGYKPDADVTPEMVELLTATHFLRNPPDGSGESDGDPDELRLDRFYVLEGALQLSMNSLLGITIECARCHDHKYDPISQKEYYKLQSIFFPAFTPEPFDLWLTPSQREIEVGTRKQLEKNKTRAVEVQGKLDELAQNLRRASQPFRRQVIERRLVELKLNEEQRQSLLVAWEASEGKQREVSKAEQGLLVMYRDQLAVSDDELAKQFPAFAQERERVNHELSIVRQKMPAPPMKIAALFEKNHNPPPHHLLVRGSYTNYGEEVEPGVPEVLATPANQFTIEPKPQGRVSSGRRTAFARWVTSPENPLFRRVMVNRIWQQHFGIGIVATTENFGPNGAAPTHPELLDYLADEFRRGGDRLKPIHRLIMNSTAYRQSSAPREDGLAHDPDNRLWWRFPLRRLDGEAIRDAMLAVTGELDRKQFGPYVPVTNQEDAWVIDEHSESSIRRSIYVQQRRSQVLSILEVFDVPAMPINCAKRYTSTSSLQSLTLLNSQFIRQRASAFAERLIAKETSDDQRRLDIAYFLALGRPPNTGERQAIANFLATQRKLYDENSADADKQVWSELCQMILASNAFLYVE